MLIEGSKAYSILKMKCPSCHQGDLFLNSNPYVFSQLGKMHEYCSKCHLKYDMEPGFFLGAMYVSYIMAVAIALPSALILSMLFSQFKIYHCIAIVLGEIIVLMPMLFHLSRSIWLNIFIPYKKL